MKFSEFHIYLKAELNGMYSPSELKIVEKVLIERFCDKNWLSVLAGQDEKIYPQHLEFLLDSVRKLKHNEPLEYVTGYAEFRDLKLWVNEFVLIPRPETEELVEYLIRHYKGKPEPQNIIDIGTGSGCIAISLKKAFPSAVVTATDISPFALATAKYNASLYSLELNFCVHDMLQDEQLPVSGDPDIIVSNPPYVLHSEYDEMHDRVKQHEPSLALFANGDDPLNCYRCLKDYVLRYLKPGGCFMFELNSSNAVDVLELFCFQNEHIYNPVLIDDAFGKERFVFGRKAEIN